ncbi:MAG: hypothetical protein M1553_01260 [Firmicutes bacterium]|nr:hypothetical protein [Bacillota bacterium]
MNRIHKLFSRLAAGQGKALILYLMIFLRTVKAVARPGRINLKTGPRPFGNP